MEDDEFSSGEKVVARTLYLLFLLWMTNCVVAILLILGSKVVKGMGFLELAQKFNRIADVGFLVMLGGLFLAFIVFLGVMIARGWED